MQQSGGQIQTAAHAAGIGAAAAIDPVAHRQQLHQLADATIPFRPIQVIEIALQLQQLAATEDLVEGHLLGHIAQPLAHATRVGQGIEARHPNQAGIGSQQGGEDAQAGGLAGAIRAKQPIEAAARNAEVEALQGLNRLVAPAVALADVLELNHRLWHRRQSPLSRRKGTI